MTVMLPLHRVLCRRLLPVPALLAACCSVVAVAGCTGSTPASAPAPHLSAVGTGWARSSVNAVIFRQHGVVSHGDTQYTAFYDSTGHVVLAQRTLGTDAWRLRRTPYTGTVRDAHNAISLGVDGRGVLHVAWDLHGDALRYARAVRPGALELTAPLPMTGERETQVTYPQFYPLDDGDLLFVYRDGSSGDGDVLLNRYDVLTEAWSVVQHPLIDGEGQRNAYVNQLAIDDEGGWHVTWTWRETWDVATNHDIMYAYSPDEGATWTTSGRQRYALPITQASAEVVRRVPQGHELINQTGMTVDREGQPLAATYWRLEGTDVPQLHLVWFDGAQWQTSQVGQRTDPFSLSGGGTKRIPLSRPQVVVGRDGAVHVVARDDARPGSITVFTSTDAERQRWTLQTAYAEPLGAWEPVLDPVVWRRSGQLHLFVQHVGQGDGETLVALPPQTVSILAWTP